MAMVVVAPLQETLLPKVLAVQECKESKLDIRQNPGKDTGKKFNEMTHKKSDRPAVEKTETAKRALEPKAPLKKEEVQSTETTIQRTSPENVEAAIPSKEGFFTLINMHEGDEDFDTMILSNIIDTQDPLILEGASLSPTLLQKGEMKDLDHPNHDISSRDTQIEDAPEEEKTSGNMELVPSLYQAPQKAADPTPLKHADSDLEGSALSPISVRVISTSDRASTPEVENPAVLQEVSLENSKEVSPLKNEQGEETQELRPREAKVDTEKLERPKPPMKEGSLIPTPESQKMTVSQIDRAQSTPRQSAEGAGEENNIPDIEPQPTNENRALHSSYTISAPQPSRTTEASLQATAIQVQLTPSPMEQVTYQVRTNLMEKQDEITVELRPASLGTVKIKIEVAPDGRSNVVVAAERTETLDLLRKDHMILQESLKDSGVDVGTGNLEYQLFQDQSAPQQKGAQPQRLYSDTTPRLSAEITPENVQTYRPTHNGVWEAFA